MDLDAAEELCRRLIDHHLGGSWQFGWDRARRRFGQCRFDECRITLSRVLTELNDESLVRDTVLHEIAHALAPRDAGHGPEWKGIVGSLGARPTRAIDPRAVRLPDAPYVGVCPGCGMRTSAHRRRRVACRRCCDRFNRGRYTARYELSWSLAGAVG